MQAIGYVLAVAATVAMVWMRVTHLRDVRLAYAAGFSDGQREGSGLTEPEAAGGPLQRARHGREVADVDVPLDE